AHPGKHNSSRPKRANSTQQFRIGLSCADEKGTRVAGDNCNLMGDAVRNKKEKNVGKRFVIRRNYFHSISRMRDTNGTLLMLERKENRDVRTEERETEPFLHVISSCRSCSFWANCSMADGVARSEIIVRYGR
ncbi:hypothetical protein TNCT_212801, partial [Trichonephila clavata]